MRGVSVVIPVYNEEENVAEGFREVSGILQSTGLDYEIIYVDDGSKDSTVATLLEHAGNDPHLRLVQLRRYSDGQQRIESHAVLHRTNFERVYELDGHATLGHRGCSL